MSSLSSLLYQILGKSISNISYFLYLIIFTYLIIPSQLSSIISKLIPYLPETTSSLVDYIFYYQCLCALTIVTFIITNFALINSDTSIKNLIFSSCSIYTCLLVIYYIYQSQLKQIFSLLHANNYVLSICTFVILAIHLVYFLSIIGQLLIAIKDFFTMNKNLFFYKYFKN